jgi:probable rRNA maturation factor
LRIRIFYDEPGLRLKGWRKLAEIIKRIILERNKLPGDISIIIVCDKELQNINKEFLEHDYFTDVVTFNYNEGNSVNGEIYISKDTVTANAGEYKVNVQEELKRVVIHGILHLTGMDDKTDEEREEMHKSENRWLTLT